MNSSPVTLQISLAPSDYRHARVLLPHQVRAWQGQVDEVLLTVDFHRSHGRFSARWEEGKEQIVPLAESIAGARVELVDYSDAAMRRVSEAFFGGRRVPAKDYRGGPYYSYFFGLTAARHDHVLHVDSDMFFGGGSQTWMAEAVADMAAHPEVLFAAPLSGPPSADGRLLSQVAMPEAGATGAFRFDTMSTRLFLLDRRRFRATLGALRPRYPRAWRNLVKAVLDGNPPQDFPEHLFTAAMRQRGLVRREFLGTAPGLWSLPPPYRCADFYAKLPELIRRIEAGDVPEAQRGHHDLNASMVDWSEAIAALRQNRWWKRLVPWIKRGLRRALSAGLRCALRMRSRPYAVDRNRVALVIAPHQDDETLGCGGLLLQKRLAGAPVWIAYITDGGASHPGHPTLTPAALAALRQGEARRATHLLGVEENALFFLGAGDGTLAHLDPPTAANVVEKVADLLRQVRPDEIFLPMRDDGSSEHEAAFVLVQQALARSGMRPRLFEFPVWSAWNPLRLFRPLGTSRTVWRVDYRRHRGLKRQAIGEYVSQIQPTAPWEKPMLSPEFLSYFCTGREFFFER